MWAVSRTGVGTDLEAVWNGVPALSVGVPMSAAILILGLSRNLQAASMAFSGLRAEDV